MAREVEGDGAGDGAAIDVPESVSAATSVWFHAERTSCQGDEVHAVATFE
jgi:hypothetical protein